MLKSIILLALSASLITGVMLAFGCSQTQIIETLKPKEAFNTIEINKNSPNYTIIDIRTPQEFAEFTDLSAGDIKGYIEGAINIDYYSATFEDELNSMDKSKIYLIYCQQGDLSEVTLATMEELNFKEVYFIKGGIEAWISKGLPVME